MVKMVYDSFITLRFLGPWKMKQTFGLMDIGEICVWLLEMNSGDFVDNKNKSQTCKEKDVKDAYSSNIS